MSATSANSKKTTAPKTLRSSAKTTRRKVNKLSAKKTSKAAGILVEKWQDQMKKYQKNLESLVSELKTLDKESAKNMLKQAQDLGEKEWQKICHNVEAPMGHFLKDLHNAKQNLIRDSEEMVKQMRARLKLLQKQVKKTLNKSKPA